MGREPRTFTVWATIIEHGRDRHEVVVKAMAIDLGGPEETLTETIIAANADEAKRLRIELVRELCGRLEADGHTISDVGLGTD